jgi:valyl-tRNA synthetase
MPGAHGLMARHPLPVAPGPRDEAAEAEIEAVRDVVTALRAYRSRRNLPPRTALVMDPPPSGPVAALDPVAAAPPDRIAGLTTVLLAAGSVAVGAAEGAVDPDAERRRVAEELETARGELTRAEGKLGNARFVERAPADLVEAERQKVERYTAEVAALTAQLDALSQ